MYFRAARKKKKRKKKERLDKYQRTDKPVSVPSWEISVWIREEAQLASKEQSSRS